MLEALQNPIVLVVLVLVVAVVAFLVIRRRRAAASDVQPPVIGDAIDYTAIPFEEPQTPLQRIQNAPAAVKLLAILVPLLIIGALFALPQILGGGGGGASTNPTLAPIPVIDSVSAEAVGNGTVLIRAKTTLGEGEPVSVFMKENDVDFPWFDKERAIGRVSAGSILIPLPRAATPLATTRGNNYTIILVAMPAGQPTIQSAPATIIFTPEGTADFFGGSVAAQPTATSEQPTATSEQPTIIAATPVITATVRNGGNIRSIASPQGEKRGLVAGGESVTILAKSADGQWYRVRTANAEGWVSATLLSVDAALAAQLPEENGIAAPAPTPALSGLKASVFNGGNVRTLPSTKGEVLDQINAGETVSLIAQSPDGKWLLILNPRSVTGWVSETLLTLPATAKQALPVSNLPANQAASAPTPAAPAPAPSGTTATVFNGGNVRESPNLTGKILAQLDAGETVGLLAKTPDATWFKISVTKSGKTVTGWVSRTLLTLDAATEAKIAVAP